MLHVFTFSFPWCDVRYDFRIETMFGSSLPPVVCMSAHVFICVCLCIVVCNTYCFCFVFRRLEKPYVASFSGLLIFDCPFGIL
jgi:hypothetical protein